MVPFGRFVVATRTNELAAVEPDGRSRWTLARPAPSDAAWAGTRTDARIAYADRSGIRVVAGDGSRDRLVLPDARGPVAWRPGSPGACVRLAPGCPRRRRRRGRVVWASRTRPPGPVRALEWSSDGQRLLVLHPTSLRVYDARGQVVAQDDPSDATKDADAAFRPGSHDIAVVRLHGSQSTVFWLATGTPLFDGTGALDSVTWSPDGRWLLVAWPTVDQWVFVPGAAGRRLAPSRTSPSSSGRRPSPSRGLVLHGVGWRRAHDRRPHSRRSPRLGDGHRRPVDARAGAP